MNCDGIARWYRWLEYAGFGRALERRREAFLADVADARRVLVLGGGDGRALAALLKTNHQATIDSIDVSAGMLGLARTRAGEQRVTYHRADAREMPLGEAQYDLIVTHFFLDCFEERDMKALVERVARAARPEARWVVSEFRRPGMLVGLLYFFFRITTGLRTRRLVDHRPFLAGHGFGLARCESAWWGRLASELWARPLYNEKLNSKETSHENACTH
jgi:ubiquinone/menaquinone biosynthesis C-methylase UbiE